MLGRLFRRWAIRRFGLELVDAAAAAESVQLAIEETLR